MISVHESIQDAVAAIELLYDLEAPIRSAAQVIERALLSGKKVLTCGNGGSAADSSHLATEIACRFIDDRRPFPAISLSADGGLLTATANDYSFNEIFSRQVIAFGTPGDVLIALSTSGQSENIVRALEQAKGLNIYSIAILGRDGGRCRG
ncbi:MAG TPA: SIS domain-containing protein, partial [Chthoniobacterales bacterium]